jgi:hypothetical protein
MNFFDKFPKIPYDINGKDVASYELVTNIFFRFKVISDVLNNIAAYYDYVIQEGDTPEILADKIYNDPEAHWVILLVNNIIDAQHDWPLDYKSFNQYIQKKYDLISLAKTQTHHYEMVITREESSSGLITETRFVVDLRKQTEADAEDLPYDYYENLAEDGLVETFNMGDGKTVIQTTSRNRVTNYDWEVAENEKKRNIKIIKPEYWPAIREEFSKMSKIEQPAYIRRVI